MLKAFIFDFYGVICSEIGAEWYATRPPAEAAPELKEKYDHPSDLGTVSEEEFFNGIAGAVHLTGDEVRKEWLASAKINQEVIALVRELRPKYKTAICSNTAPEIFKELLESNELENLFDVVVASSAVGMVKPGPEIFHHTLRQLEVLPEEAVFIDDNPTNVEGARAAGIPGILFLDSMSLQKEVRELVG